MSFSQISVLGSPWKRRIVTAIAIRMADRIRKELAKQKGAA
jgi:hypothetical protein